MHYATDRRGFVRTQVFQIQWNNAMQRPLRRSRSFKVTDFGTSQKLMSLYDFLLVILAPFPSYGCLLVKFSLARGECLSSTLSLRCVTPCQYRHKWYIPKNRFFGLFPLQKVLVCFRLLLLNPFPKLPNSVKLRGWGYYAVQGYPRSLSLVRIESSWLPMIS